MHFGNRFRGPRFQLLTERFWEGRVREVCETAAVKYNACIEREFRPTLRRHAVRNEESF